MFKKTESRHEWTQLAIGKHFYATPEVQRKGAKLSFKDQGIKLQRLLYHEPGTLFS
jgi:hypothetical protein